MAYAAVDQLVEEIFENYQVLWNDLQFHIHHAEHLGALASLGASKERIKQVFDTITYHDPYETSPHAITHENWRQHLGDGHFCKAYKDYFLAELPATSEDAEWKKKLFEILLDDTKGPALVDAGLCGGIHPLIHAGYAVELNNRIVAIEALSLSALCYDFLPEIFRTLEKPTNGSKTPIQVLKDINTDDRFSIYTERGRPDMLEKIMKNSAPIILEHYNEWKVPSELDKMIEELFDTFVYLFAATHKPDQVDFDFFLLHLVTGMHGIRSIRSYLPEASMRRLLLQMFYYSCAIYIRQLRPEINENLISEYKTDENKKNWNYVIDKTLTTRLAEESHLVKIVHTLKDAESEYGSKDGFYLTVAIKAVDNLDTEATWNYRKRSATPWVGTPDTRDLNVRHRS